MVTVCWGEGGDDVLEAHRPSRAARCHWGQMRDQRTGMAVARRSWRMVEEVGYGFGVVGLCGCYWAIGGLLFRLFAIFGKIYMISRDQAGRQACLYSEILSTFQKVEEK